MRPGIAGQAADHRVSKENDVARTYSRSVGRSRRQERARGALREKGWAACVLGVALLTVFPLVAGNTTFGTAVTQGLRPVGWTALGLGVVLLALHYALKGKESKPRAVPPRQLAPGGAKAQRARHPANGQQRCQPPSYRCQQHGATHRAHADRHGGPHSNPGRTRGGMEHGGVCRD